jgi:predicted dehydrogenase
MVEKMVDKIGVAVIGLGFVGGKAHVSAFRKIPGAELIAVVDMDEAKAKELSSKYKVKCYFDHKKALEDPEIDAVVVAVPTPYHFRLAYDAIVKGKHVLCEMPLTPKIEESKILEKEAKNNNVLLLPDLNFRFTPNYVKAKEIIECGEIGTPLAITFSEFIPAKDLASQWPISSWAWNKEKSGGYPDFTLSVWSIDLYRWLINSEIEKVNWVTNYSFLDDAQEMKGYNTLGLIRFSNGCIGTLQYSATVSKGEGTSNLAIYGDNTKTLKARWNETLVITGNKLKQTWEFKEKGTKVWGHYQIDAHFIECISKGKQPKLSVQDAIESQKIALKMVV